MKYVLYSVKVEGSSTEDFTALTHTMKPLAERASLEDAMSEFNQEVDRHRKAGGQVKMAGIDRAFFINGSDRPYEMLDIEELREI